MKSLLCRVGTGFLAIVAASCLLSTPGASAAGFGFDWDRSDQTYQSAQTAGVGDAAGRLRPRYLFPKQQKHMFFSVQFGERTIEGDDFDGSIFYTSDTELYLVPKFEPANFLGLMVEGREDWLGYQIGYSRAKHDYSWGGIPAGQATTHFIDFNFLFYAMATRPIQPFGMLGFSLNGLRIEDGKYNAVSDEFFDSSMYGAGFNYGLGVDYYLGIRAKFTVGARWHYNGYNSISGQDLDEGLKATGYQYYVSLGINSHS